MKKNKRKTDSDHNSRDKRSNISEEKHKDPIVTVSETRLMKARTHGLRCG